MQAILKFWGGYVPLEKIRDDTCINAYGTTAYHLIMAAQGYGLEAMGVRVESILDKNIYLPAIAHVVLKNGLQHFVVVYKITSKYVYLMDPAVGKKKMLIAEFNEIWDNILILLAPTNDIIKYTKEISLKNLFIKLLVKNKQLFIKIFIINFIFIFSWIISVIPKF